MTGGSHRGSDKHYINGLVQERRNSSALAMELRLSCINPSIWYEGVRPVWNDTRLYINLALISNGTQTIMGHQNNPCYLTYQWRCGRLQYLQCVINGDTAVLHQAIDNTHSKSTNAISFTCQPHHDTINTSTRATTYQQQQWIKTI